MSWSWLILNTHIFIANVNFCDLLLLWNHFCVFPCVCVSLSLLCESAANWQPAITTHLPRLAPTSRPTLFLKYQHSTFLNWSAWNSIYLRSVAAEFAASTIGFGKIGVKTPDRIKKVRSLKRETIRAFERRQGASTVNSRIKWQLGWSSSALTLCLQRKWGHTPRGLVKAGHTKPTSRDTFKHTVESLIYWKSPECVTDLEGGSKGKVVIFMKHLY